MLSKESLPTINTIHNISANFDNMVENIDANNHFLPENIVQRLQVQNSSSKQQLDSYESFGPTQHKVLSVP